MKSQLSEVSALLDGELAPHEHGPVLKDVARDRELRAAWQAYVLIGDQLRRERPAAPDLTAHIMAKIGEEPVVLAPRNLHLTRQHPLLALAASVAGVAVVGWLTLVGNSDTLPVTDRLAAVSPAPTFVRAQGNTASMPAQTIPAEVRVAARSDMSEYLLAHHTQAATFRLGDSTEHIRTVSMTGRPDRP